MPAPARRIHSPRYAALFCLNRSDYTPPFRRYDLQLMHPGRTATAIAVCMTVLVGCVTDGSAKNDYPALPLDAEDDFDVFLSDDVRDEDNDDGFNVLNPL